MVAALSLALGLASASPAAAVPELVQLLREDTGLQLVSALAPSPDWSQIYTANAGFREEETAVAAFRRDGASGDLEFLEVHRGGVAGVRGLHEASALVATPDGRQVLALGRRDETLVVFDRMADGTLSFARSYDLEPADYDRPEFMALSPDGSSLYVTSTLDDELLHYRRDPAGGELHPVAAYPVESLGADQLGRIEVSRDGRNVYAIGPGVLVALARDPATGALSPVSTTDLPDGALDFLVTPNGRWVLTIESEIHRFARDPETGALSADGFVRVRGISLAMPPDAGHVYACDAANNAFQVLSWDGGSGDLTPQETFQVFDEFGDRQLLCGSPVLISPDGRHLYTLARLSGRGALLHLEREPATGALSFAGVVRNGEGLPGPLAGGRAAVVSPAGDHVYATFASGISAFGRDREGDGILTRLQTVRNNRDGVQGLAGVRDLATSPDGSALYAVSPGAGLQPEALSVFRRDPATGLLAFVGALIDGLGGPGCCVGGDHVLVSPDGRNVYTLSAAKSSLGVYRVLEDGGVEPVDVLTDGVAGVGGLAAPTGFALTPDGHDLYVTSESTVLAHFRRDAETGLLEVRPGVATVLCAHIFDGAFGVATSPDGQNVYATTDPNQGNSGNTASFARDPATGALSFLACFTGTRGVQLATSPDERYGFGTTTSDFVEANLVELRRDEENGQLSRRELLLLPLESPGTPAVSPDGLNVYVSAADGLAAYRLPSMRSEQFPGYRFRVEIGAGFRGPIDGTMETECLPETLCVSGALAGRTEILVRIAGPKPNGRLWPFVIKSSTSAVDLWIAQLETGALRHYLLPGARPGSSTLPGLFDRSGFRPLAQGGGAVHRSTDPAPPPPAEPPFTSEELPGFRFWVRFTAGGEELPVRLEPACIPETVCLSGAVAGRSEVFFRIVGPKPNGYLWPTLTRLTTSTVEIWVERIATGELQHYVLEGAAPGSNRLDGLFDRLGFPADGP